MSGSSDATDQYANSPVPEGVTIPGWRVGLIVASFSIGLPDFLNGGHNALALGLGGAAVAALIAALVLCVGGCLTSVVSVRSRLSTYLLTRRSFGTGGAAVINIVIALIHFCWFGVNASLFGEVVQTAAQANGIPTNFTLLVVIGAVLMTSSTLIGFRALDRLAMIAVPALGAVLLAVVIATLAKHGLVTKASPNPPVQMSMGIAISALIGNLMLAIATMPDLSRFIRTQRGAATAMAISYPIATPLMMVASAIPVLALGELNLMKILIELNLGTALLFLLVLPTWTINALNLYSASLSLGTTFPAVRQWIFIVAGGTIGTILALAGILDAFIPFILFLSLIIPPVAAIYVIDSLTRFRDADSAQSIVDMGVVRWPAMLVWLGSAALACMTAYGSWTITTVPAFDATIAAALAYLLVLRLERVKRVEATA